MTREQYELALHQAYMLAGMAAAVPTGAMLERIARADAIGPILDPTLYLQQSKKMLQDKSVLEAVHALGELVRSRVGEARAEKTKGEAA